MPSSILFYRSSSNLTIFFKRFIKNFSTIMTPITYCLKKGNLFDLTSSRTLYEIKRKMMTILVLKHFDLPKASVKKLAQYLSFVTNLIKPNNVTPLMTTIIQISRHNILHLLPSGFILSLDHKALYIQP